MTVPGAPARPAPGGSGPSRYWRSRQGIAVVGSLAFWDLLIRPTDVMAVLIGTGLQDPGLALFNRTQSAALSNVICETALAVASCPAWT